MLLLGEFFYSLYLMMRFKIGGGVGIRYPLSFRGKSRYLFVKERDRAESSLFNDIKFSQLAAFLSKRKVDFTLVSYMDDDWVWINVYYLDKKLVGDAQIPVYNEKRGVDGTFTYLIKDGRLLKARPVKGFWYTPGAILMTYRMKITNNEREYLCELADADIPQQKILEIQT